MVEIKILCDMCGTESTFRMVGSELTCNFCNTAVAKGEPALKRWKVMQEELEKLRQEEIRKSQERISERRTPDSSDFDLTDERQQEEYMDDYDEREEEEEMDEAEFLRSETIESLLTDDEIMRLYQLAHGGLLGLKICVKLLNDQGLIPKAPGIPAAVEQLEKELEIFKLKLGINDTQGNRSHD